MDPATLTLFLASAGLAYLALREDDDGPSWGDFLEKYASRFSPEQRVAFDAMQDQGLPPPTFNAKAMADIFLQHLSMRDVCTLDPRTLEEVLERFFVEDIDYLDIEDVESEVLDQISKRFARPGFAEVPFAFDSGTGQVTATVRLGGAFDIEVQLVRGPNDQLVAEGDLDMWCSDSIHPALHVFVIDAVERAPGIFRDPREMRRYIVVEQHGQRAVRDLDGGVWTPDDPETVEDLTDAQLIHLCRAQPMLGTWAD